MRTCLRIAALLAATASLVHAQQGRGSISGTVSDQQGARVRGAQVEVRNSGTNAVFRAVTSDQGYYSTPSLPVGDYAITAEMTGFKKELRRGLTLQVDQKAEVNFTLQIGAVAETVEVTGEAVLLDTSSATVGKVVESRRIQELPLNGRNALSLTLLTPSVKSNAGSTNTGFTDRGTAISSISINGGPNAMNGSLLDGGTNVMSYYGEVNIPPAVDAVEEFKVQSGTMSAEFGFTAGGVINLVTRSGTNQLHGSLYEFLRNDKLDARNTFAPVKNPLRYNQYGAAVGGRIIKDRTFFFGNYEEYKLRQGSTIISSAPIEAQRNGDFSTLFDNRGVLIPIYDPNTTRANPNGSGFVRDLFPGNRIPSGRLDPVSQNVLKYYPLPNRAPSDPFTNTNNFSRQGDSQTDSRQYTIKIDHKFSDRNSLYGRYSYFEHKPFGTSYFPDPVAISRRDIVQNKNVVVSDTHTISPTLINDLRVGLARQYFTFISASYGANMPQKLGLPPSVPADLFPIVNFGYTAIGNGTVGARGSLNWDFTDIVTKIKGSHTLKGGGEHRLLRGNNRQSGQPSGSFTFNTNLTTNPQSTAGAGSGLASFVLGTVASASIDRVLGQSMIGYDTSFFVQDDWKVTRRLTLNIGLRYDFQQEPLERNNGISNFDPYTKDPVTGLLGRTVYAGLDGQPRSFRPDSHNNFSPRFGFAWDPAGDGKLVVRGGYAIFYPSIFAQFNFGSTAGFSSTTTTYNSPGSNANVPAFQFSQGLPSPPIEPQGSKLGSNPFLSQAVSYTEYDGTMPMSQQWNLSVQKKLAGNWMVDVTYSGNRGQHFAAGSYDLNALDPQYLALGQGLNSQVPNPNAGKIPGSLGAATISKNQALARLSAVHRDQRSQPAPRQLHVEPVHSQRRETHVARTERAGFLHRRQGDQRQSGDARSTSARSSRRMKSVSRTASTTGGSIARSIPTMFPRAAVVSVLYELPFGRGHRFQSSNAVVEKIIGGWQVNTIGAMQTGLPIISARRQQFPVGSPQLDRQERQAG